MKKHLWLLAVVILLVTTSTQVISSVIYVKPYGDNSNPGTSWNQPKKTVQAGIDAAAAGDEVWVSVGKYVERITMKSEVKLYGGFAGSETDKSLRNSKINITILQSPSVSTGYRASVIKVVAGATRSTVIDGFTMQNGEGSLTQGGFGGGGICCDNASPTISNNTFSNTTNSYGAGIFSYMGTPLIKNNLFFKNYSPSGAGVYCVSGSPVISGNIFTYNTGDDGVAVYIKQASATVTGNLIIGNYGSNSYGCTIYCQSTNSIISNNTIVGNASERSTVIYNILAGTVISNNIIAYNSASIISSDTTNIKNNCFYSNADSKDSDKFSTPAANANIFQDPKLASLDYINLHIQRDSPCVDKGNSAYASSLTDTDIDGDNRILGAAVDIGADESDGTIWSTDPPIVHVSPQGDDKNDGRSWNTPKKTIQGAVDSITPFGGEIWVKAGTYYENVSAGAGIYLYGGFNGAETSRNERNLLNKTIILAQQDKPAVYFSYSSLLKCGIDGFVTNGKINAFFCTADASNNEVMNAVQYGIFFSNSSGTITNNKVYYTVGDPTYNSGYGICCDGKFAYITITDNDVCWTANGTGISAGSSNSRLNNSNIQIRNNRVKGNSACGISAQMYESASVTGNVVIGNGNGIYGGSYVANNSIVGNGGIALTVYPGDYISTYINNLVAFNVAGIKGEKTTVAKNNLSYGNRDYDFSGWTVSPVGINGNISEDPKIASVDTGDIHIQPDSPCINKGDNSVVKIEAHDIEGDNRIIGTNIDIGADESDGTLWQLLPGIIRVSPDGDDANDGSSWQLAKRTIQSAINTAAMSGGEIWVKAGTYKERITIYPYCYLYGGFNGTEIVRSERNWSTNKSIIDGEQLGSVVTVCTGYKSTKLDGFIITNGRSTKGGGICCNGGSPDILNNLIIRNAAITASCYGGGIYCGRNSSPVIANNFILWNSGSSSWGAGIYCDTSTAKIINNTIVGGYGAVGGGIYIANYGSDGPRISNNIIAYNNSGISTSTYSSVIPSLITNNCIYGNTIDAENITNPIGTYGNISVDPAFADAKNFHIRATSPCVDKGSATFVVDGWADIDGDDRRIGQSVDIGADESDGTAWDIAPTIVRVGLDGDDANDGLSWDHPKRTIQAALDAAAVHGGEVWVKAGRYEEYLTIRMFTSLYGGFIGTETERNQRNWAANRTVIDGGGNGGVITTDLNCNFSVIDGFVITGGSTYAAVGCSGSNLTITHNIITRNARSAISSGGSAPFIANNVIFGNSDVGITGDYGTLINNTIVGNNGNGVYCSNKWTVANNIIAFNSAGIYVGTTSTVRNNCIFGNTNYNVNGNTSLIGQNGNFSSDPKFVNWQYGELHLQLGSLCINKGDNSAVLPDWTDVEGEPRIISDLVDIGADESTGSEWPVATTAVVRVAQDGSDFNDGATWSSAKRTIQAAIDSLSTTGGEVWVKAGCYTENIKLNTSVYLYGGFAGSETRRSQRDFGANVTVIDGGKLGSVISATAPGNDLNCIDGFTIRNGIGTEITDTQGKKHRYGGGIYCRYSSPKITNNTITGNSACGIYCSNVSAVITGNRIVGNNSGKDLAGGGISLNNANCIITSNVIANNNVPSDCVVDYGGGIYSSAGGATICNNTIIGNTCLGSGGGIFTLYTSGCRISNNIVAFNSSGIDDASSTRPTLSKNCFYGNKDYDYYRVKPGTGDINLDPKLVNVSTGDYRLKPGSPCIDSADALYAPALDINGAARPQDGNEDGVSGSDMGAYEYPMDLLNAKKTSSDGTLVTLGRVVVTAVYPDAGCIYVERLDRSNGIRIDTTASVAQGALVNISGLLQTDQTTGERFIQAVQITDIDVSSALYPLAMANKMLGGSPLGLQDGVWSKVWTKTSDNNLILQWQQAKGLNNTGLLIKLWGRIDQIDPDGKYFYIDDGSNVNDDTYTNGKPNIGVRVTADGRPFHEGQFVEVTGISSCFKNEAGRLLRLLKVKNTQEVRPL